MLEMGRWFFVLGDDRPAIVENPNRRDARVDHGFDGEGHAGHQDGRFSGGAVVRHLRLLVEAAADTVPYELTDDREATRPRKFLHGAAEVGKAATGAGVLDRFKKGLLSHCQQSLGFQRDVASRNRGRVVTDEAAFDNPDVNLDDVSRLDLAESADAVNHLLIDRDADGAGKSSITEEGALAIMLAHHFGGELVDLSGGPAGPDLLGKRLEDRRGDGTCRAHEFDFTGRLDRNTGSAGHEIEAKIENGIFQAGFPENRWSNRAATSSCGAVASQAESWPFSR